jgi:hypothetical protein
MTKLIKSLTPEQKARFNEFRIKWTNIGLCTLPADRPTAEKGIELIYQAAGLKKPRIVWCGSPLTNALTRAFVKDILKGRRGGDSVRASVWDSVWDSVRASVGDSVRDSVRASVWASVRDSVRDSVGDSVRDSVGDSVRASVWDSVWDSVRASVGDSVRASVWDSVWDSVGDSVGDSVRASVWASVWDSVWDSVRDSGYGQHDANWLAFYEYFKEVCGLIEQTKRLTGHWMIARSANWYLPYKNICWISERHNKLFTNERGRLHCENGMALTYPDGWGIYALNGILMKPEYVLTPAGELSPETVLKERSVDIRRELLRKIGVLKMKSQGKIIETTGEYELIDMSPVFTGINYAPHLLMRNPSLPDTFHLEGVGPQCHTIEQAINWRAGNINIRWTPAMLS